MKFFNIAALALTLGLGACATQRFHFTGNGMSGAMMPSYEKSQPFFIGGIGQTTDVVVSDVCGKKGAAQIHASQTALDGILSMLTFGIYTPRTVAVFCQK